jgi:hypothetical protein
MDPYVIWFQTLMFWDLAPYSVLVGPFIRKSWQLLRRQAAVARSV